MQGRKLSTRLSSRVKEEQHNMKAFLQELALNKAREIERGLQEIRATVSKPPGSLQSYVDYVSKLQNCREQKELLAEQKKRLEDMKGVLSKFRSKDEGYQNLTQSSLQNKIESLNGELAQIDEILTKAEEVAQGGREENVQELEKKIIEE